MTKYSLNYKAKRYSPDWIVTTVLFVLCTLLVLRLAFGLFYVKFYVVGSSMQSTLVGARFYDVAGGDYVYVCKNIPPKRGDIVVIDVGGYSIIKRVIAMEGDRVELKKGVLYLNGKQIDEPYVDEERNNPLLAKNSFDEVYVGEGKMFVMGDNRNVSSDSRTDYGCLPVKNIVGVVASWSLDCKSFVTKWNTFFDFGII